MPTQDFAELVGRTAENIKESDEINDRNKELIRDYLRDQRLKGLSDATLAKNLSRMKQVAEYVDEPLDELDKDDMKDVIEWIQGRDYTEETVGTYKGVIKAFWMWLDGDGEDHPETVKWITSNGSNGSNGTLPTDLLTKDDIEAQADAASNKRDKALIWMLWETGARIGELIDITVGDIEDRDDNRKKVVIDGKTGPRRVPLVDSVSHINKWLNEHPNPEKDAPLWCKIQQGGPDDQLGYRYIRSKILARTMDDAGIDKPSNPHHYRHSRASHLANKMTEAQLCEFFGWVQGSSVPAKYVHLSGRDLDNAYDEIHGLSTPDEDKEEDSAIECWRCEELNERKDRFCWRCGAPLDETAHDDVEQAEDEVTQEASSEKLDLALKIVEKLEDDPDSVEQFLDE